MKAIRPTTKPINAIKGEQSFETADEVPQKPHEHLAL